MSFISSGGQFHNYKKLTEPLYRLPMSVQQTIPVCRISKSGIFEIEKKKGIHLFDKAYELVDFGYAILNEEEQEEVIKKWCSFLGIFNTSLKIVTINHNKDMEAFQKQVLVKEAEDPIGQDFNRIITERIVEGKKGIEQSKQLIVTVEKETYEDAAAFFQTLETDMKISLEQMGAGLHPLDWKERLRTLHNIYRIGEEARFFAAELGFEELAAKKQDWKNDVCSTSMKMHKDYFKMGGKYCCTLFARKYPSKLKDSFISEVMNVPYRTIVTEDIAPIPDQVARDKLNDVYLLVERSIQKQQDMRNKNHLFSTDISYDKRREKEEIEEYMDAVNDNDESMFFLGLYITVIGDSLEEMNSHVRNIKTIGDTKALELIVHKWCQRRAFQTALPLGGRYVRTMRAFLSQGVGVMIPFYAQELLSSSPEALYYGINRLTKNLVMADRKLLPNGNGFILAPSGSGKGVFTKNELFQVLLRTRDNIILVDPQNEYFELVKERGGQVVNLSLNTENYLNPLEIPVWYRPGTSNQGLSALIAEKTEFMLSLCEHITDGGVAPGQKTIVDQCVKRLYEEFLIKREGKSGSPTLRDFQQVVQEMENPLAKDLALSLGLFTEGSLSIFSHESNVDMENRLLCFGIDELGESLRPLAMLVMLEAIKNKIQENAKVGKATRIYIDECHVLTGMTYTQEYLQTLWKKVRKQGGLCTGITQNLTDLFKSKETATMVSNSEYIMLLRQQSSDLPLLQSVFPLSDPQLKYLVNQPKGTGMMKFGDAWIPVDSRIPKGPLYDMVNTDLHEKVREGKFNVPEGQTDGAEKSRK